MSFRSTNNKIVAVLIFFVNLYGYGISMRNEILFDLKTKLCGLCQPANACDSYAKILF